MDIFRIMKIGDWILIVCAIIVSIASAIFVWIPNRSDAAGTARIYFNNEMVAELPLDVDTEYTVENDGSINVIEVSDGRVHMLSANCNDEYCVKQGYIEYNGDTIICLPHRVVVELSSTGKESPFDAISG